MSEQKPSGQPNVHAVYDDAANLRKVGISSQEIINRLKRNGLDDASASAVVTNLLRMREQARRQSALKNMAVGGVIGMVGIVVTVCTYSAASTGGDRYVIAWGAIIFGGLLLMRGLRDYRRGY
jgi:hypothetical protein